MKTVFYFLLAFLRISNLKLYIIQAKKKKIKLNGSPNPPFKFPKTVIFLASLNNGSFTITIDRPS